MWAGHCQERIREEENLCCKSIQAVAAKLDEAEDIEIDCITDHLGLLLPVLISGHWKLLGISTNSNMTIHMRVQGTLS